MHILIINFNLEGVDRAQYQEICDQVAPVFAGVPGLISKQWLANEETNTYGGVYRWEDRQAMLAFQDSELFSQIASNPALANVTATDFELMPGPSAVTRGM